MPTRSMSPEQRFKRLKDKTGLNFTRLAEIFGVDLRTVQSWYRNTGKMQFEFQQTLLRLEAENLPALSPQLRPETVAAFYAGRRRLLA